MAVNRYMQPREVDQQQTYISQHVPHPYELMLRAADNAQAHYDDVAKNIENTQTFLNNFKSHTGKDTEDFEAYRNVLQSKLDEITNSGDLRFAEDKVRELGKVIGESYRVGPLGKYITSGKIEAEYSEAKKEAMKKKMGEGAWSTERQGLLADHHAKWVEEGYGGDFDKAVTTRIMRGSPNVLSTVENLGKQIKEGTIKDQTGIEGTPAHEYYKFLDVNTKGIEEPRALAVIMSGLAQDSDIMEEAVIRAAYNNYQESGVRLSEYKPTKDQVNLELLKMANHGVLAYTHEIGNTDATFLKNPGAYASSEEAAKNPVINLTVPVEGELVGALETKDSSDLEKHIEATKQTYLVEGRKVITEMGGKDVLGLPDMKFETVYKKLSDPMFRDKVKTKLGKDGLDKLDHLALQHKNAENRKQEAYNEAKKQVPELFTLKTEVKQTMDSLGLGELYGKRYKPKIIQSGANSFGVPNIIEVSEKVQRNQEFRTMASNKATEFILQNLKDPSLLTVYKEDIKKMPFHVLEQLSRTSMANNKPFNAEPFKQWLDSYEKLEKDYFTDGTSKHEQATKKFEESVDNYLKKTSDGFVKTQGGSTTVPMYKPGKNGLEFDKASSDAMTKVLYDRFSNPQNLTSMMGKVKSDDSEDGWIEISVGTYIQNLKEENKDNASFKVEIGKPTISKSLNGDGKRFIEVSINNKNVHIPLTETTFPEIKAAVERPVKMQDGGYAFPHKVDEFLHSVYNSGNKDFPLEDGRGVIHISRNPNSTEQQREYTFFNDNTLKITRNGKELTGQLAYNYLLNLQRKGQLR